MEPIVILLSLESLLPTAGRDFASESTDYSWGSTGTASLAGTQRYPAGEVARTQVGPNSDAGLSEVSAAAHLSESRFFTRLTHSANRLPESLFNFLFVRSL
jgi:hypothetical protein